ncbi:deoxycytidylate deaminase [Mesorhizobium sp. B1-1-9]|uniref:anti-phage dCTP deaminase n=1 Tax=Mesorhizobium sp. B1-1-9 TaxID=2589975 RepID=UPI00112C8B01|nr:anti-phage dCTP deaminase [Mesorhizobium sp. B1-1-9]TPN48908.1 deoxycytidylate deaminase [Mesorhizobium sp. B1-1-9]
METQLTPVEFPELVIGIAGPIGVDIDRLTSSISSCLEQVKYRTQLIKLTSEMGRFGTPGKKADGPDLFSQINWKMDCANEIRTMYGRPDTLARIAIQTIREFRRSFSGKESIPAPSQAYLIRQLKLPEEVQLLRRTYGRQFILVSAYASEAQRFDLLARDIARSLPTDTPETDIAHKASMLIARDAREETDPLGQNLRETFHLGDVFTHGVDKDSMETTLERFFQAFFGRNDITPSRDEYGMYTAKSASLRSADLSRQVGSAIFSKDGTIVSQGCNEVPKSSGGNYWDGDVPDYRDIRRGFDPNDTLKKELLRNVLERLSNGGFLSEKAQKIGNSFDMVASMTNKKDKENGILSDAKIMDVTEFGRVVHAEMNAICDAARIGNPIQGTTLYCTTFPCHNCTKHIVACGIKRVVFMEPYPKSKAHELHGDEIQIESESDLNRVSFVPFLGISPYRYRDIFQKDRRKAKDGKAALWYAEHPKPMVEIEFPSYPVATEPWAIAPLLGNIELGESPSSS